MKNNNTIQIQEVNLTLSKIADGIADLLRSIHEEKGCEVLSNLKYIEAGIRLLEREYINQYGEGVISLKDFDRSNLGEMEEATYKRTLTKYKGFKEITEELELLITQTANKEVEDDTFFTHVKTAYRRRKNKNYLRKLEKAFIAEAGLLTQKVE